MRLLLLTLSFLSFSFFMSFDASAQKEGYGNEGGGQPEEVEEPGEGAGGEGPVVRDGIYDKISVKEREILKYDHIREADVFWQKRIWRVIDTRQKMNLPFVYPEDPFINILLGIAKEHPQKARIFLDDEFMEQISIDDVEARLNSVDTIMVIDPVTYAEKQEIVKNDFNWLSVNRFRVKEDWVFDEETSTMQVRILAIAPIRDVVDDNGNFRGQEAMFYAYYPDFREEMAHHKVYNPDNDLDVMTWDDIFQMRWFSSYIMKESNIYDRRIENYSTGRDALLESERIKREVFEQEHNLWTY